MPTAKLDVCDIKFQAANLDGVICHFVRKVTQASLSREVATRASKRLAMRLAEGVFLFGTADHCRHLIRHLSVTPSPTGEGNRKALFRQQIYNETVDGRMD